MISRISRAAVAALLLMAAVSAAADDANAPRDPMTYFFNQGFGNLHDELATARSEGKRGVFIMFDDPDCPWCAKMKATVLSLPRVQAFYRANFRTLQLSTRGDDTITDFNGRNWVEKDLVAKVYRVRATPVFIFFDLKGRPVQRFTGATRDADEFMWLGKFVASGEYKRQNFIAYKRARLADEK